MEAFDKFKQLPFTTITFRQKRLRRNLRASGEDREITTAEIEPAPWVNANDAHYRLIKRFRFPSFISNTAIHLLVRQNSIFR
jgi:hypothetical protein